MAEGEVLGTGDTDVACKGASFGKWVFIKYNNGLSSTFGHLSAISVKKGQKVKAGTIVGLSGNTGSSTGPHLHVAVYASTGVNVDTVPSKSCGGKIFTQPIAALNAYLNPLDYLPKTTKDMFK
jgi:murein DD-endopeptidase MepM/ murein hydrolase activator NlpD